MITHGPLQWDLDDPCGLAALLGDDPVKVAVVQQAAIEWLWQVTGCRFGIRATAWRPEVTPAGPDTATVADPLSGLGWLAAPTGYLTPAFAGAIGGCTNPPTRLLRMPGPVNDVTEVRIGNTVLPASAYRLEGNTLRRLDGQTWPTSQDVAQPLTAAGTWQVTFDRGRPAPAQGQRAAGLLACELAKRVTGAKDCKIPPNAVTVSRAGTVINLDRNALQGLTNVVEVDQWIRLVNPTGQRRAPRVWAPETRTAVR